MNYKITDKQLLDYIMCPIYYNLRYTNKFKIQQPESYNTLINQVVNSFLSKLLDGEIMNTYDIKRKWDMISKKNPDIITPDKNLKGISALLSFYRWAQTYELIPVDIAMPYNIVLKDDNININSNPPDSIELSGHINSLILTKNNQNIEELIVDFSSRAPDQTKLDMDLKISLNHIAFYLTYKKQLIGTRIYHVKTNKVYYTVRDPLSESNKIKKIALNIAKSIDNNLWYPHQSPLCPMCKAKDFCRMWGLEL